MESINNDISFSSVEEIPTLSASAAFTIKSSSVFREDEDIVPVAIDDRNSYMPWGGSNQLPFDIIELIEKDETLSTCQIFNAEVCYGSGLKYMAMETTPMAVIDEVSEFSENNDIASYFLGVCQDFKHFGFAVSVVILNAKGDKIVRIARKEACYCRFSPIGKNGRIDRVYYANWRKTITDMSNVESIELLDSSAPLLDLRDRIEKGAKDRKFAVVSKVPTVDSTYYPIPHYASIFKGKWYDIKQLIGIAKEAKLRNTAAIKYHIEINAKYWESIFRSEGITDRVKQQQRVITEKQNIIDFLTGAENSGKAWFSTYYTTPDGNERRDVVINRIDHTKEGGDWETDIQEAINMICFTMRVHSNLVGSVPGKTQSNNSGSDKRELYTIAQALQKPYRDLLFAVHRMIISFNKWKGVRPDCPFMQLTTLDEHQDAKQVTTENE